MATFRGELHGNRGSASRLGSKQSGLVTVAQTWSGQIAVHVWQNEAGEDCVNIYSEPNPACYGQRGGKDLWSGTVKAAMGQE